MRNLLLQKQDIITNCVESSKNYKIDHFIQVGLLAATSFQVIEAFLQSCILGSSKKSGPRHAKPTLFLLFELRCLYYAYPYHDVASVSKGIIFPEHRPSLLTTRSRSRFEGLSSSRLKCAERGSIDHVIRAITITECVWLMGRDASPPEPNIRFPLFISDDPIPRSGPSSTSEYIANAFHTSLTWRIGIF
jgi:hypothetical protein